MNDRAQAAQIARQWLDQNPLFLDTETTGLDDTAQICDLAVIDHDGVTLLDTLVKPTIPIPKDARAVHGISNADVAHAPTFAEIVPNFVLIVGDRPVVVYNLDYDTRLLHQSATAHGLRLSGHFGLKTMDQFNQWHSRWHCAMKLYAQFHGEWNEHRGDYRWQSLANAAHQCGINIPPDLHRARADAELTRQVLLHVAKATPGEHKTTKRCGRCGNEIPDWSGGVCPVCERLSSGEKRFWKGGEKRPRPRQAQDQPAPPSPARRIQRPTTKSTGAASRPQQVGAVKRPLGKQTQGRRRLDNFNRLLQEVYGRPVRFGYLLAEQGIPQEQISRWRQDGIWLLRFLKRLHQELVALVAKAHPDQDPQVLNLWYGLDGKESRPMETIATELNITTADVRTARRTQLNCLRGEQGQAAFEKAVLTAAKASSPSLP